MIGAQKYRILVVDDENLNILNLTHILSADYTVYAAKSGRKAIAAAEKYLPDLILLDIIMPDMDGYEVISKLKASEKTSNIPVIFITGLSDPDDEEKGLALGAADYLIKPFSPALVKLRVLNQIKLIEQFITNEYDIMKYKLSNDALGVGLWDMDVVSTDPVNPGNRFIWSQEFRHMLGFSDEHDFPNVLGSWGERVHPEDRQMAFDAFAAHLNDYTGMTPFDIEYRMMQKNGSYRYFHAMGTTFRDRDGVPIRVAGALLDINDKKQAESKIAEFVEKIENDAHWYKSILDAVSLPLIVTDENLKFTFVNKAVERFLGEQVDKVLGKACGEYKIGACGNEKCGASCAKHTLKQTFFEHNGLSYQSDVERLIDKAGEVAGYVEIIQDITNILRLTKQQTEAEMQSRAKSTFLANMSHEIRTPMNAIWGIIEILMQDEELPEKTMEDLSRIRNACGLLLGIINDILDLSKIEAGKLEIRPIAYDVASLLNDAIALNLMRRGDKDIELDVSIDENTPAELCGDEMRIKQILNNLLSNAFKYTDAGNVAVAVSFKYDKDKGSGGDKKGGGMLVLRVSDTGRGMTKEQLDRLFDEYSRFNQESIRTIEGVGLGMAITKQLLHLMGGEIKVKSEPDKGSVFTVHIPQAVVGDGVIGRKLSDEMRNYHQFDQANYPKGIKNSQIIRHHMPYGSVLVVDDVESNIYVAEGLMKPYGLKISAVMSGAEAIEKVKNGGVYDIIFMDHMMPEMDGIEAVQILRKMGYDRPIVALTANALVGQADMFLKNGFNAFVSKPIDIRRLNSILNHYIHDAHAGEVTQDDTATTLGQICENPEQTKIADRTVAGIDIVKGLERYNGDEESYLKILRSYAASVRAMLSSMDTVPTAGEEPGKAPDGFDIKRYEITVHGIKGASYDIFADNVGDAAKSLEMAAKSGDMSYIKGHNAAFLDAAWKLISGIDGMLHEINAAAVKQKKDRPDGKLLESLLAACESYDMDGVDKAMAEIEKYEYENDEGLTDWLRENADLINYEQMAKRLAEAGDV
ncbi:MAG: response regulator [Oscillospiraceae bacterium]|nr:response regulator [Oscillospiraceae bacterium]